MGVKPSVEQGFQKPQGYRGKVLEGRGQGIECLTPHKPLPLSKGKGIPSEKRTSKEASLPLQHLVLFRIY